MVVVRVINGVRDYCVRLVKHRSGCGAVTSTEHYTNQCGLLDLIQLLSPRLMRTNFRHHLAAELTAHQQAGLGHFFSGDISRVCISIRNLDFVLKMLSDCSVDRCVAKLPFLYALKKSYAVQMIHRNWIQHCHKASLFIYFQLQVGVV